ncbi:MAG: helix-turn-helix domain-containing protein [Haloarculaceae archaeon]
MRDGEKPELSAVLTALDDEDCRAILLVADEPRSTQELAERADVPQSTTYRKVDLLREAKLVEERTEIRADGKHTSTYRTDFEAVRILLDGFERFEVEIERPDRTPDTQLADLWREVRKET